jgi:hypothetical protein
MNTLSSNQTLDRMTRSAVSLEFQCGRLWRASSVSFAPVGCELKFSRRPIMSSEKYSRFSPLNPFFDIVMNGLDGLVDGDHSRCGTSSREYCV